MERKRKVTEEVLVDGSTTCPICEAEGADGGGGGAALEALARKSVQLHAAFASEAAAALKRAEELQRERADALAVQCAELGAQLGAQVTAHRARVQRWDETAPPPATHLPHVVRLSVGGVGLFATSADNLRRFPESYFGVAEVLQRGRLSARAPCERSCTTRRLPPQKADVVSTPAALSEPATARPNHEITHSWCTAAMPL